MLSKRIDEQLERLAESLNGIVVNGDISPLVAEKIYSYLSKIETQQLEEKQLVTKIDRYHWFLIMALLCLMMDYLLPRLKLKFAKIILPIFLFGILIEPVQASHPGVKAYNSQKFEKAESEFKTTLNKKPDNARVIYNLGNTYFKLGDHDKSINAYKESIESLSEKDKVDAYYNLGTAYLEKNDIKNAFKAYKEVLKRDPNHLKTKQNIEIALRQKQQQQQQQKNGSNQPNDDSVSQDQGDQQKNNNNGSEDDTAANDSSDGQENSESSESPNGSDSKKELSEQQIQYLVDNAEKEAREKRQKKQTQLFEDYEW